MREPKLGAVVGKKGVGKSYTTLKLMGQYVGGSQQAKPRRVLILDVNDEYENIKAISLTDVAKFSMHPKVEVRRIRPYQPDGTRMTLRDFSDALFTILEHFKGGLLLIEDINKYVSDSLPNDLIGAISIGRITPKIWQNLNWLRFHKNSDSVDRHKKKFEDKYSFLKIAEIMVNKEYFDGNKRFFIYVDTEEEKLMGEFTPKMLKEAIDEFISLNYNSMIKPQLNRRDSKGNINANPEKVIRTIKDRLFTQYYGNNS